MRGRGSEEMSLDVDSRILVRCQHCLPKKTVEGDLLEKLLPPGYNHLLCVNEPSDKEDYFRAHLKVRLSTKEEVQKWLQDIQHSSTLTWRMARTYPQSRRYNSYRVDLRCQHKKYSSGKRNLNTNCPATLYLVLKRATDNRRSRSRDPHIAEGYFLHVSWRNQHNHQLACAEAVRKRDVSATTIVKLTELFEKGHSPSSALDTIKYDQQVDEGENYLSAAAYRSICPDIQFCNRSYGAPSGEKMLMDQEECIEIFSEEQCIIVAQMERTMEGQMETQTDGDHQSNVEGDSACNTAGPRSPEGEPLERQLDELFGLLKSKLRADTTFTAPAK